MGTYRTRFEIIKLIVHTTEECDDLHENLITAFDKWQYDDCDGILGAIKDEATLLYKQMLLKLTRPNLKKAEK